MPTKTNRNRKPCDIAGRYFDDVLEAEVEVERCDAAWPQNIGSREKFDEILSTQFFIHAWKDPINSNSGPKASVVCLIRRMYRRSCLF